MNEKISPYAHIIIRLLQGVVYNDTPGLWNNLMTYQTQVREYFHAIGVDLFLSESDGFAFLKNRQKETENEKDETTVIPDLFSKRQLGYQVSLLSVLLLERLIEFDTTGGDSTRLILNKEEIKELVTVFLPEHSNEAKYLDMVDTNINRLIDYGFLKKLNNNKEEFEVKRILKAKIDADKLAEIKERLAKYAGTART